VARQLAPNESEKKKVGKKLKAKKVLDVLRVSYLANNPVHREQ